MFERSTETNATPSVSSRCRTTESAVSLAGIHFVARVKIVRRARPFYRHHRSRSLDLVLRRASEEDQAFLPQAYGPGTIKEIPVFPLGIVAFPTADVPLNIFEARYRVLFNTLLAGSTGIEEDLVNEEKTWAGSRLFGMCYLHQGGMAAVGTTLHIVNHERLPDGRLFVLNKGIEKFRVLRVVEERPVMVCQVEMLEDKESSDPAVQISARESIQLFKDLIQLNVRMNRISKDQANVEPRLDDLTPREISYWLGLIFTQSPPLQQSLLEEPDVGKRIWQEREILEGTIKFLRAKVALQSAFSDDDREASSSQNEDIAEDKSRDSGQSGPD